MILQNHPNDRGKAGTNPPASRRQHHLFVERWK